MLMREKVRENEVLLSGTMTLRSKALAGGRQSLYIDCFEEGRHRRESLSLYLEAESTVRSRRANAATMRRAEALRQVFLFTCFTGLRLGDCGGGRWEGFSKDGGQWRACIVMRKTSAPLYLPLSNQALKWMPERDGKSGDEMDAGAE